MGWTTAQAANHCGMAPATFRKAMQRERDRGNDMRLPREQWPDRRTPLYDPAKVTAWGATPRPAGWIPGRPRTASTTEKD